MLTPFSPTGSLFRPPSRTSQQGQLKGNAFDMGTGMFRQQVPTNSSPLDANYAEQAKAAWGEMAPNADPYLRDQFANNLAARQQALLRKITGMYQDEEAPQGQSFPAAQPGISQEQLQQYLASGAQNKPRRMVLK